MNKVVVIGIDGASPDLLQQWIKEGKSEASYGFAGLNAGFSILDVESVAELNALVTSRPNHPFVETEIYPLISMNEALTSAIQTLEAIKAKRK